MLAGRVHKPLFGALLLSAACSAAASPESNFGAESGTGGANGTGGATDAGGAGGESIFNVVPCSSEEPCEQGEICKYLDRGCGATSTGHCAAPLSSCSNASSPVCGCDGKVYSTVCAADAAGVDITDATSCEAPTGTFACGEVFCLAAEQACKHWVAPNEAFYCFPLPRACIEMMPPVDCSCFGESAGGCKVIDGHFFFISGTE